MEQKTYNAAVYARLSRDDAREGESISIENQREMLTEYVRGQGWNLAGVYTDDGISGTTFDRPGLNQMLGDVQQGRVNLVIVKDLSRFGRDYIEVGKYMDIIFPAYGCRFIALNDHVDTINKGDEMVTIFKNVFNDFYARDTSNKIKAVKQSTFRAGKYIGAYAPYGYKKDPDDKHRFLVDEPAAAVVRRIFELRGSGMGMRRIAKLLNEENVTPPRDYYYQCVGRPNPHRQNGKWGDVTVRAILRNEAYIGNMVQNKSGTMSYKNHKAINKPKEDWVRIEDTHEPIITPEAWALAREIDSRNTHPKQTRQGEVSLFYGMLVCMDCGFNMRRQTERRQNKSGVETLHGAYMCGSYSRSGHTACSTHFISQDALEKLVLADIQAKAELAALDENRMAETLTKRLTQQGDREAEGAKKTARRLEKRLSQLDVLIKKAFEEKVLGSMPESLCAELMERYQGEKAEKSAELQRIQEQLDRLRGIQDSVKSFVSTIRQYSSIHTLERETLLRLVDKIEVGERHIVDGRKEREIKIHYKFVGYVG